MKIPILLPKIFDFPFTYESDGIDLKLGKKCTTVSADNTYEKSFVWIVNKSNLESFEGKINKKNCKINLYL